MCGIAGLWAAGGRREDALRGAVEGMISCIVHRGPDDSGVFLNAEAGVALGFRRLAILDVSELGHQPMRSASGRYTMIYNGEVYNFQPLRDELERLGATFRGHSDTEVMLAAFERWGIEASVKRFVGMFAIAVWDAERRALTLVRDRMGIKPLHLFHGGGVLAFGSELKVFQSLPEFDRAVDRNAVAAFLRYLYVPAPQSIYRGIRKLPPGHLLTITDPAAPLPASVPFWSVEEVARRGAADQFTGALPEAVDELERVLGDAVKLRLISDVPLGALLSGGVDSSLVVALMCRTSSGPVKTYTIAFDDPAFNEAAHAARVAQHLGTQHTELMVSGAEALALVPRLPDLFDEPLADPSQIPTYFVCQLARREVTVALSGDGGDELFTGYNRYLHGERLGRLFERLPRGMRRGMSGVAAGLAPEHFKLLHGAVAGVLPAVFGRLPGGSLLKLSRLLDAESAPDMYRSLLSALERPAALVPGAEEPVDAVQRIMADPSLPLLGRMQLADQVTYLADDLLAKVDRASMAVSLEARVPILDHRVVEFSWRLPRELRVNGSQGKRILRELLYRHVPRHLVDRPKMGFSVPLDGWLRGPLRDWAEDLVSVDDGVLDTARVRGEWQAFLAAPRSDALGIWAILMFRAWQRRWESRA